MNDRQHDDQAGIGHDAADPLRRSKTSGMWTAVVIAALLAILLVIFIAQNTRNVQVSFLWMSGHTSLAVALLIAAILGLAIAALVGTLRIWQVHRRVRRAGQSPTAPLT